MDGNSKIGFSHWKFKVKEGWIRRTVCRKNGRWQRSTNANSDFNSEAHTGCTAVIVRKNAAVSTDKSARKLGRLILITVRKIPAVCATFGLQQERNFVLCYRCRSVEVDRFANQFLEVLSSEPASLGAARWKT